MSSTARGLTPASEEQLMAALMRGGEMLASGQLMEARELLEQAQALDPKHEKALNLLGLTYFKLGNFPRAAEIYEALVNDNPADATLRVNLGLVYLKANDVQRSVKEFETATDLEPEHKKAHNYLGLALAQSGEFARAQEHFVMAGSDAMADKMAKALAAKASEPATITLNRPKAPPPPPPAAEPPAPPPLPTRAQLAPEPPPPGEAIEVMSDEEVPPMGQDDSVEIEVDRPSAPPAPIATDWGQQLPPAPEGPPPAEEPPVMEATVAAEEPPLMAEDAAVVEASVEPALELPPSAEDPRWAQGAASQLSASETSMYANPYADAPVMEATVDAPPAEPAWLAQPMGEVNLTRAQAHAQVEGVEDAPPMVVTAAVEDAEYVEAQAEPPAVVPTSQPVVEHEALLTGGQAVLVVENAHEAGTEVEVAPAAAAPAEDEMDFGSVNEAVGATPIAPPPPSAPLPVTVEEEPPLALEPKRPAARVDVEVEPEPAPAPLVLEKRAAPPALVVAPSEPPPEPEPRPPPDQQGFAPMRAPKLMELGASTQWVAEPSAGTFHISNEGLAIFVEGEMLTRMTGLVAIVGSLDATPEVRRARGRALEQPFGAGASQMQRVKGNGVLYLEVGKSRFHAFDIDDEAAYLREERLFAFEEPISYENGRLSTDGGHALDLVHLTGKGRVLVQLDGNLKAMPIPSGNPMVVPLGRVVGWFGHVNPRLKVFAGQASVELTGEGFVLLGAAAEK